MTQEYNRSQRVGDLLQREIAILVQELRDPRLGIVSITGVNVTRDLSCAKVYFTMLGCDSEIDIDRATLVLNRATSYLRRGLSKTSGLRSVPKLRFYFDFSINRARNLNVLIHKANNLNETKEQPKLIGDKLKVE